MIFFFEKKKYQTKNVFLYYDTFLDYNCFLQVITLNKMIIKLDGMVHTFK